jgi:hypothetical protein
MDSILAFLTPFITGLASKYPVMLTVVGVMGTCRLLFKPTLELVRSVVKATPTLKDDAALESAEKSMAAKIVAGFFNYVFSIKWPEKPAPKV